MKRPKLPDQMRAHVAYRKRFHLFGEILPYRVYFTWDGERMSDADAAITLERWFARGETVPEPPDGEPPAMRYRY